MAEAPTSPAGGSHESGGEQSPQRGGGGGGGSSVREQDRYLPIANISRIMKKALPTNGKIAKDAKDTVQECVSEFISFVTSEASDKCQKEKRKTINGDDLLWAMATLGFEDYIEPLRIYLSRLRVMQRAQLGVEMVLLKGMLFQQCLAQVHSLSIREH
ncbi:nuclear transcription factor Y subunit B-1-like isoform X2 [Pyrus x bretschneideri]|uniref:nuclear transcription factor Y subunit B-1-like isoform X2 n=1 Tax=Pyrus x bretschneideri TaxID=225117 RepID=UPI00202F1F0E|nr:nuclear transcription factor Y subunit B-1-like isoform X2 [Pyrus x bretschneideri]